MRWTAPFPTSMCEEGDRRRRITEGAVHMQANTIGIDLAKNVFQVHSVDAGGKPVLGKQLRRGQILEFFRQATTLPDRHGSVRHFASLGSRAEEAGPRGEAYAAELRQGLCQARQERCGRCRGDLRGGNATLDAL